ncbi:MAG: hypothetical protein H7834_04470, partial [Magnetococcus sp. YQC-9]
CEKCAARRLRERRFRFLETTLTSCTQPCKKLRIPKQVRFSEKKERVWEIRWCLTLTWRIHQARIGCLAIANQPV